jgi:hypothetical protein
MALESKCLALSNKASDGDEATKSMPAVTESAEAHSQRRAAEQGIKEMTRKNALMATALIGALALVGTIQPAPAEEANPYAKCYDGRPNSANCVMKVMAALNHKPNDAEEFVGGDTVIFTEPMMSCPNVDNAHAADRQTADWLEAHGCKNLNPNVKEWVVVNSGLPR